MHLQHSEATAVLRRIPLHLVDQTDGITPETGEAGGQTEISKNGGAFASTTNTLVAIGNGAYYVELTATELDTLGLVIVRYDSANTAEAQTAIQVVGYGPYNPIFRVLNNQLALTDGMSGNWVLLDDDDATVLLTYDVADVTGSAIAQPAGFPSRRTRGQ